MLDMSEDEKIILLATDGMLVKDLLLYAKMMFWLDLRKMNGRGLSMIMIKNNLI